MLGANIHKNEQIYWRHKYFKSNVRKKLQILQEHNSLYRFKDSIQDIIFLNNTIYGYVNNSLTKIYVDLVLFPEL